MDSNSQAGLALLAERIDALELAMHQRLTVLEARVDQLGGSATAEPVIDSDRPAGAPTFIPVQHPWVEEEVAAPQPAVPQSTASQPAASVPATAAAAMPPPPSAADRVVQGAPASPSAPLVNVAREPLDVEAVLRWVGVGLVTLAGIFFIGTAIDRGWLTPEMQLVGAALAGAAMLAAALYFFSTERQRWSVALGVGGSIVLIASAVASYGWREMVSPGVALVLVAAALAGCLAVSWRIGSDWVGTVAAGTGLLAPIAAYDALATAPSMVWVLVVMAATTAIGLLRSWLGTRLVGAWIGAFVIFGLTFDVGDGDAPLAVGIIGLIGGCVLLLAGPLLATRRDPAALTANQQTLRAFDLRSLTLVPAFAWVTVLAMGDGGGNTGAGVAALLVGAGCLALAAIVWLTWSRIGALALGLGASGVIAVGFMVLFDAPVLMVALAAQAVASLVIAHVLDDRPLRISAYVLAGVASLIAFVVTIEAIGDGGFDTVGDALATFVVGAMWAAAAVVGYRLDGKTSSQFTVPFVGAWAGLVLWLLAALLAAPEGLSLTSAAWAILAGIGIVVGLTQRIDAVRAAGLATLALMLAKLFTADLAEVDVLVRVVLFFVVGVGLIVLGVKVPNLISRSDEGDQRPEDQLPPMPPQSVTSF